MNTSELSRSGARTNADLERAKTGLRKLLKRGRVSPAAVLACPDLVALGGSLGPSNDDGTAAAIVAEGLRLAIESVTERDAIEMLFGVAPAAEGELLRNRREKAAALLDIKPESFRVRREAQLVDRVADELVARLANPRDAAMFASRSVASSLVRMSHIPTVFVSHSAETADLVDGLGRSLEGKADVTSWLASAERGLTALETLEYALRNTDFAAFVLSPDDLAGGQVYESAYARHNLIFELGLAMGFLGRGRTFIAVPKASLELPSDLVGFTVSSYDLDEPAQAAGAELARRIWSDMLALGPRVPASTKSGLDSDTDTTDLLADAALSIDASRDDYADELRRAVQWGERVPMKLQFAHGDGGRYWLGLCRSLSYGYYHRAKNELSRHVSNIAELVREAVGGAELDIISLGCGDGSKDNMILRALVTQLGPREHLRYYPVEISDILLVEALRHIARRGLDRSCVRCKAILGDFTNLAAFRAILEARPSPKLFSVLGNTIGSFDESEIISSLDSVVLPGDLVLIEANVGDPEESVRLLADDVATMWTLSTLEALEVPRASAELRTELLTNASAIPGTRTVINRATSLEGTGRIDYRLSAVHHYRIQDLKASIALALNLTWLAEIAGDGVVLLLGQRQRWPTPEPR